MYRNNLGSLVLLSGFARTPVTPLLEMKGYPLASTLIA
jgi:hypothetical protein